MKLSTISVLFAVLSLGACKNRTPEVVDASVASVEVAPVVQDAALDTVTDAGVVDAATDASADTTTDAGSTTKSKAKVQGTPYTSERLQIFSRNCVVGCVDGEVSTPKVAYCACTCGAATNKIRRSHATVEQVEANMRKFLPSRAEFEECVRFAVETIEE
jgi:hypothetical protein